MTDFKDRNFITLLFSLDIVNDDVIIFFFFGGKIEFIIERIISEHRRPCNPLRILFFSVASTLQFLLFFFLWPVVIVGM